MTSGIGGAVFFSPLFMLVLRLEPAVAIGTAQITELFGFSSGVYAYWSRGLIDFRLERALLLFAAPAAVVGSLSADLFPADVLRTIFATGIIFIGAQLYLSHRREERERLDRDIEHESVTAYGSVLRDTAGREYRYTVCNRNQGRLFAATGGLFLGMISVGLAELQEYHLLARCRVPSPVAVGTSIFVVVVSVVLASAVHAYGAENRSSAVSDNSADPSRHDRLSGRGSGPIRQVGESGTLRNAEQFGLPRGALHSIAYHPCCA